MELLMSVRYKTKFDRLAKAATTMGKLNGKKVYVGALQGEHAWLAGIHEYGCKIPVTDKMRKYLAAQGLYLKSSTKYITIPERSFLRTGHDQYADEVIKNCEMAIGQVIDGKMSIDTWLDAYGQMMADKIKLYIRDLKSPPNHPYTIEQKGSSNPIVDSGGLIETITWKKK